MTEPALTDKSYWINQIELLKYTSSHGLADEERTKKILNAFEDALDAHEGLVEALADQMLDAFVGGDFSHTVPWEKHNEATKKLWRQKALAKAQEIGS